MNQVMVTAIQTTAGIIIRTSFTLKILKMATAASSKAPKEQPLSTPTTTEKETLGNFLVMTLAPQLII